MIICLLVVSFTFDVASKPLLDWNLKKVKNVLGNRLFGYFWRWPFQPLTNTPTVRSLTAGESLSTSSELGPSTDGFPGDWVSLEQVFRLL